MLQSILNQAVSDLQALLPAVANMAGDLQRLGDAMLECWRHGGKVLMAGNGGSAADAMHFAEELCVRYRKNRRALAAMALCDPSVITCAGNDFGYESVFARQVEALGNAGDVLVVMTTSGNSANLVRAVEAATARQMTTAAMLGGDGGRLRGRCQIELLIPSPSSARVQECHKLLYHSLCEWIDTRFT